MTRFRLILAAMAWQAMTASAAGACPFCVSDTAAQVRGMLADDPVWHLAVTLAPIPVLGAAVALVRRLAPWLCGGRSDVPSGSESA
jgi:hypothetical protein